MKYIQKDKLSYRILELLEKSIDGYLRLEDFVNHTWIYARGYDRPLKKASLSNALARLKNKGFISQQIDDANLIFKLTDSGRDVLGNDLPNKEWDGKWRVVIFDIPEQKRVIRNLLRRNLKKRGFKNLQKSVWVSKMDCLNNLKDYIKYLQIDSWVTVLETNQIFPHP